MESGLRFSGRLVRTAPNTESYVLGILTGPGVNLIKVHPYLVSSLCI